MFKNEQINTEISNTTTPNKKIFRLRKITERLEEVLSKHTNKEFWVQANLIVSSGGVKQGNFYCELVDFNENNIQVAKMRAIIWKNYYFEIIKKLTETGQQELLTNNSEICALCSIRYHGVYGLSLEIKDIDPYFGIDKVEFNRRKILEKLKKENLIDNNSKLKISKTPLKIGLISSANTAAYNDFIKTLMKSKFAFKILFCNSNMQGNIVEYSTIKAIKILESHKVDIICIVRGGGSQLDLTCFDNENIARTIANCKIPVWTGIGHEIDSVVIDFVSHTSFKTPTAVAEKLLNILRCLHEDLLSKEERFNKIIKFIFKSEFEKIKRKETGLTQGTRKHLNVYFFSLENNYLNIKSNFIEKFNIQLSKLNEKERFIINKTSHTISSTLEKIYNYELFLLKKSGKVLNNKHSNLAIYKKDISIRLEFVYKQDYQKINYKLRNLKAALNTRIKDKFYNVNDSRNTLVKLSKKSFLLVEKNFKSQKIRLGFLKYEKRINDLINNLELINERLKYADPTFILKKGFAIVKDVNGNIITNTELIKAGDSIITEFEKSLLHSIVNKKELKND